MLVYVWKFCISSHGRNSYFATENLYEMNWLAILQLDYLTLSLKEDPVIFPQQLKLKSFKEAFKIQTEK